MKTLENMPISEHLERNTLILGLLGTLFSRINRKTYRSKREFLRDFTKVIDSTRNTIAHFLDGPLKNLIDEDKFWDEFIKWAHKRFIRLYGTVKFEMVSLEGRGYDSSWFKKENYEFTSWKAYLEKIVSHSIANPDSIRSLDRITDKVIMGLGNPQSLQAYLHRGLLMGDVQCGKTMTFTGVCHKAFDVGYKLMIVLTGTTDSLQSQTYKRLYNDLINVGGTNIVPLGENFASNIFVRNRPTVVIVKKNATVLKKLYAWLQSNRAKNVSGMPCVVIDDECDNASINTKNATTNERTTINEQISKLIHFFDRCAYLGVTATPFANIFIDPQTDWSVDSDELPNLFPSDFMVVIKPSREYYGVERYFSEARFSDQPNINTSVLVPIGRHDDEKLDDEELEKELFVNRKVEKGALKANDTLQYLPKSLIKAIQYFVLVCAMNDRLHKFSFGNMSMMLHVDRFVKHQGRLGNLVGAYIDSIIHLLESNSRLVALRSNPMFTRLVHMWNEGLGDELWYYSHSENSKKPQTLRRLSQIEGREFITSKEFLKSVKKISLVVVNSVGKGEEKGQEKLKKAYETKAARMIVIGGDALARGLTIEGLCVTYFCRHSRMYDSLLQTGRWFGYRDRDVDFMKVFMSMRLIKMFRTVAETLGEFRAQVESMSQHHKTPREFGLRIRRAPSRLKMLPTARSKMQNVRTQRVLVDFSGSTIQSLSTTINPTEQEKIWDHTKDFLQHLPAPSLLGRIWNNAPALAKNEVIWTDLTYEHIASFIETMDADWFHWSYSQDPKSLATILRRYRLPFVIRLRSISNGELKHIQEDYFEVGQKVTPAARTLYRRGGYAGGSRLGIVSGNEGAKFYTGDPTSPFTSETAQLIIYVVKTLRVENQDSEEIVGKKLYMTDRPLVFFALHCPDVNGKKKPVLINYYQNLID